MPQVPSAHIHRIDGHAIAPPRRWHLPGVALLRFMIGVWPATLTVVAVAGLALTNAL